jgi:hypothetical protein
MLAYGVTVMVLHQNFQDLVWRLELPDTSCFVCTSTALQATFDLILTSIHTTVDESHTLYNVRRRSTLLVVSLFRLEKHFDKIN